MSAAGTTEAFVRRLEAAVVRTVGDRDPVVLSFSGGLGSLVVAALARKRCDLRCVVAGFPHAPDVAAAELTKQFLDYRLETVRLNSRRALSLARDISVQHPDLLPLDVLSLVPLMAVRERYPKDSVLAAFDATSRSPGFLGAAAAASFVSPLVRTGARSILPRARLLAAARRLAIPDAFARVSSRDPAVGSGVAPAFRALAREQGVSVERLLRVSDYH